VNVIEEEKKPAVTTTKPEGTPQSKVNDGPPVE